MLKSSGDAEAPGSEPVEALARLRGDAERQRQREVEAEKRRRTVRKVPKTAEGIVLELYNDLVEAKHNEVSWRGAQLDTG